MIFRISGRKKANDARRLVPVGEPGTEIPVTYASPHTRVEVGLSKADLVELLNGGEIESYVYAGGIPGEEPCRIVQVISVKAPSLVE